MEALKAKYDSAGKAYGREEFDRPLGHCPRGQAVSDVPAVVLAEELLGAYPDAKVVLTLGDVDAWYESKLKTIDAMYTYSLVPWLIRLDWLFGTRARSSRPMFQNFCSTTAISDRTAN